MPGGMLIALIWQWETPVVMGWVLVGTSTIHNAVWSAINELFDESGIFRPYDLSIQRGEFIGDRARPGPIFNYARASIWTHRAESLINHYRMHAIPEIPHQEQWRSASFSHVIYALLLALTLQWSTGIASMIFGILTPTVGISCWSGGFLIYTVNSTIVLLFLMFSSFLSDFSASAKKANRARMTHLSGYTAVVLRTLGKVIAVLNAAWLLIHSILILTSFYQNCWCLSNYALLGQKGYWIWVTPSQMQELWNVNEVWSGATALAIIVPGLYIIFFMVAHHNYQQ